MRRFRNVTVNLNQEESDTLDNLLQLIDETSYRKPSISEVGRLSFEFTYKYLNKIDSILDENCELKAANEKMQTENEKLSAKNEKYQKIISKYLAIAKEYEETIGNKNSQSLHTK